MRPTLPHRFARLVFWLIPVIVLLTAGCGGSGNDQVNTEKGNRGSAAIPPPHTLKDSRMSMKLTSAAFEPNQSIPEEYTADGKNISPPLSWTDVPARAEELALIVDDPDAPTEQPFIHWVIYKLSATQTHLETNVPQQPHLNNGMYQGVNSFGGIGYGGPRPPQGHGPHHYHFTLYALDQPLTVEAGATKQELLNKMKGHVLARDELVGTYER